MKISSFIESYMEVRSAGLVLEEEQITRSFLKAVWFYCGFANLKNVDMDDDGVHSALSLKVDIDDTNDFDITFSELAIIRPLFDLYIELENATMLEATRGQGLDVFGRQTSEIQQDIREIEQDMHRRAFVEPVFTV